MMMNRRKGSKSDPLDISFSEADQVLGYDSTINDLDRCIDVMAPGHVTDEKILKDKEIPLTLDSPAVDFSPAHKADSKDKVFDYHGYSDSYCEMCEIYKYFEYICRLFAGEEEKTQLSNLPSLSHLVVSNISKSCRIEFVFFKPTVFQLGSLPKKTGYFMTTCQRVGR